MARFDTAFHLRLTLLGTLLITFGGINSPAQAQTGFSWADEYGKSPTQFTIDEWHAVIDATWGPGRGASTQRQLFDRWWNEVRFSYGAFHNIDLDLFALRDEYRPEIEAGVSRGRFAGIMSHFTYRLEELHTYLFDIPVRNTPLRKGVPLMVIGQWGQNRHFGALLTPLPDSTLLVYKVLPNHPIGLEPGDLVLGYDGVPWKDIVPTLLDAELPLFLNSVNASTDEANTYYLLQAAGLNWHLFDTIDVVKYSTGDTLHFDTNRLAGQNRTIWGSEQIDVPGVVWPNRSRGDRVSWGVVEGTKVGYIYVTSWSFEAQFDIRRQFFNAVDSLMHHTDTDGLIIDLRFNTGGGALAVDGLALLFNDVVPTVGFDRRVRAGDPLEMVPDQSRPEFRLVIQGRADSYYDKPIAVLIGPGSISAGELEARRLSFHPRARLFGKAAPGGNTGSDFLTLLGNDWFVSLTNSAMYLVSTHEYLGHVGLEPDEPVWFTREDAANGIDTVVEAALAWIDSETVTAIEDDGPAAEPVRLQGQSFPNPFHAAATITFHLAEPAHVTVAIYNLLGRKVATLLQGRLPPGPQRIRWDGRGMDGRNVPSGSYFYRIATGTTTAAGALIYVH